ncbi:MAG: hypothetical protein U0637_14350 [Phycisphaerales bacterium]
MAGRRTPPLFDLLGRSAGQGVGLPRVGPTRATPDVIPPPDNAEASNAPHQPAGALAVAEANAAAVGGVAAPPQPKPVVRVELKPMPAPEAAPQPLPQRAPAQLSPAREPGLVGASAPRATFWTDVSGGRALRIPTVLAYIIACAVVAVLLGTWFVAYKVGHQAGKDQMAEFVRGGAPKISEPDAGAPSGTASQTPASTNQTPSQVVSQPPQPAGMPPILTFDQLSTALRPGGAMTARGWMDRDPRSAGLNYLELATLQRDDAVKAVIYLTASGQDAFAIPLDAKANPANNRSLRFRLIAWPGLTSDEYAGGRGDKASSIQNAVARLGKQWGGPSDFRMPQWVKMK